jgi:acetyltransferase-like isoleucine patch superfamily enzyme
MKEKIDYSDSRGGVLGLARKKANRSGKGLIHVVAKKLWSYSLGTIALWIPVSNLRVMLHRLRGVKIGKGVFIGTNVVIDNAYPESIRLEDDCAVNANVTLIAHTNTYKHFKNLVDSHLDGIVVKKGAWIAIGSIVLPGVMIGEYSIVSAGSVVSKDVPPYSIVRGNPAKIVTKFPPGLIELDD